MNKTPSFTFHSIDSCFAEPGTAKSIPLRLVKQDDFDETLNRSSASFSRQMEQSGFKGKDRQLCILKDDSGAVAEVLAGFSGSVGLYSFSYLFEKLKSEFSADFLKAHCFKTEGVLAPEESFNAALGWGLASYRFDTFKKDKAPAVFPVLTWPDSIRRDHVRAMIEGLCLIRTLINLPPNILGTDELADSAAQIARAGKAQFSRIADKDLLEHNFPMIYAVGKASPRRPQLIEILWGNENHPHVTLVGKGIVFDTGGLDIKPPPFMTLMKKDMGGAAHVLGIAHVIMSLQIPVRLRVLIAVAENSVGGESFRPGDILQSRKGLSVEIGDTDAEGRLVLADALTYACEQDRKPDIIIDFSTLTGSARAALGYDIPAFFSNKDELLDELKAIGMANEDPVWPMPLWQPYLKEMMSQSADINNIGSGKAGAIHGALFMQQFIDPSISWIHIDCYAWEQSGKPGRPQGGADTGMRAVLKLIETKFASA